MFGIDVATCAALLLPHRIVKDKTGEVNDGLVALGSETWGIGPELWPADHADEIGHDLDHGVQARPTHFDYLANYEALVARLM